MRYVLCCLIYLIPHLSISQDQPIFYKKVQKKLDQASKNGLAGITIYIDHPKFGVWQGSSGYANIERKVNLTSHHHLHLGSVTKTYTAVVIMKMVEQGQLKLEDEISLYLPQEVMDNIPYANQMNIRQLLNMTSGIYSYEHDKQLLDDYWSERINVDTISHYEIIENYISEKPSYFPPGQGWRYSTSNYMLLALIVEKIGGPGYLHQMYSELIFEPLNLDNTFIGPPPSTELQHYADLDSTGKLDNVTFQEHEIDNWVIGDAGLYATAADASKFMKALLSGNLIKPESLRQMTNWVEESDDSYGLGLIYDKQILFGEVMGHDGVGFGSRCGVYFFPKKNISIVVFTNTRLRGNAISKKAWNKFMSKAGKKIFLF